MVRVGVAKKESEGERAQPNALVVVSWRSLERAYASDTWCYTLGTGYCDMASNGRQSVYTQMAPYTRPQRLSKEKTDPSSRREWRVDTGRSLSSSAVCWCGTL